jgi:hypothetical protein
VQSSSARPKLAAQTAMAKTIKQNKKQRGASASNGQFGTGSKNVSMSHWTMLLDEFCEAAQTDRVG